MRKVIKIGFPILCVAVIGGTFILLNRATEKISRNRLKDDDEIVVSNSAVEPAENVIDTDEVVNVVTEAEAKALEIENKNKAIDLVKKFTPNSTDCYYTNEGKDKDNYLVAIRDNTTKEARIFYSVDIQQGKIEIYEK